MKHGHVTGARRTRPADTRWYDTIQAAHLAEIEHTWSETHPETPEVTMGLTQAVGSNDQAQRTSTKEQA